MFKNILKGIIIGIAKIVPGVSGSMIAISFGVYKPTLETISNLKKLTFNKIKFLISLFLGIMLGICLFSNIVKYFLDKYYLSTILLFIGLIIGTIKITVNEILKDVKLSKKCKLSEVLILLFSFTFCILLSLSLNINIKQNNFIIYFILGFIEAFSSIVPGISGTAIFMSLGYYETIINFFSNVFHPTNYVFACFFIIGIIFGILVLAKIITFLFNHYKRKTYISIIGFMTSSIIIILLKVFEKNFSIIELIIGIILCYLGYKFIIKTTK